MYPSLPTTDVDAHGTVTLPDGRELRLHVTGQVEGDTNAFAEDEFVLRWAESGDELTPEEFNVEIIHEGQTYYLHEYAAEFVKWD